MDNKKILIATDFSQKSFKIIEQVLHYIEDKSSELFILHIVETSIFSQIKDIKAISENSFSILKKDLPTIKRSQFYCVEGKISEQVSMFVIQHNISLVVLGNSGERSHINKFLLGSNTKNIVKNSNMPSLIIKSNQALKFNTIMIPTDLSQESKEFIFEVAEFFSYSAIRLFYSYTIPFENRLNFYGMNKDQMELFQKDIKRIAVTEAQDFFDTINVKNEISFITKEGSLDAEDFAQEANELKCDLIAVHTRGNFSFFAFDLVEHSRKNILIKKVDTI